MAGVPVFNDPGVHVGTGTGGWVVRVFAHLEPGFDQGLLPVREAPEAELLVHFRAPVIHVVLLREKFRRLAEGKLDCRSARLPRLPDREGTAATQEVTGEELEMAARGKAPQPLRFPGCVLRVTQPRAPCYKLNAAMGDPAAGRTMARSGCSGFYLAVEVPGSVAAGQAFEVVAGPRETPLMTLFRSVRAKHA